MIEEREECPMCLENSFVYDWGGGECKNCGFYPIWMPYDNEDIEEWRKSFKPKNNTNPLHHNDNTIRNSGNGVD